MSSKAPIRQRRPLRILVLILAILLILLLALGAWILGTNSGARTAVAALARLAGNSVQIGQVDGHLTGPLQIDRLSYQRDGLQVTLQDVSLKWHLSQLLQQRLHIRSLKIGKLDVTSQMKQEDEEPAKLPENLSLPVQVKIDSFGVKQANINLGPANVIQLDETALQFYYNGQQHRLVLEQLKVRSSSAAGSFLGNLQGEGVLSIDQPYPINAQFSATTQAQVKQQQYDGSGNVTIDGSLAKMNTRLNFAVGDAKLQAQALLQPFSETLLEQATADIQALDLAAFGPQLPVTNLNGHLQTNGNKGELSLSNTAPGFYDKDRLPLRSLLIKFDQQADSLLFETIDAQLGSTNQPAGAVTGSGNLANGVLTLSLNTKELNLQRLDQRLLPTSLSGELNARHTEGGQEIVLSLSEPIQKKYLSLSAKATLADALIVLDHAELKLGNGRLRTQGQLELDGKQAFRLSGEVNRFHLQDLGQFSQLPRLFLNGNFDVKGWQVPQLAADMRFTITDSRLAGQTLQGAGEVQLEADTLDIPKLHLVAGANRLNVQGRLDQEGGQLSFNLDAPNLSQFGSGFAGALEAQGVAKGSFDRPQITAQWTASQIRAPDQIQISNMNGNASIQLDRKANFPLDVVSLDVTARGLQQADQKLASLDASIEFAPRPNAPLSLQLRAEQISAANMQAEQLSIQAKGTNDRHTIDTTLLLPGQKWHAQARGALERLPGSPRWQGTINQFDGEGDFVARLLAPAPLLVSQQHIELQQLRMQSEAATIEVNQLVRDAQGITTRGQVEHLQVAALLSLLQPTPAIKTDLQLSAAWDLSLTDTVGGYVTVKRERGDVTTLGTNPVALGLRQLQATARAESGRLAIQLQANGEQLGSIDVNAGLPLSKGNGLGLPQNAPLSGKASIRIPSLHWLGPMIAPTASTGGSLYSEMTFSGTVSEPNFSGHITGKTLAVSLPDYGLDLKGGSLDSSFQDTRLVIHNLSFGQPKASLVITGPIDFANAKPAAQLTLKADRFSVFNRADRRLVMSGETKLGLSEGRLEVKGGLTVNDGMFDIGRTDKPELSDDVVIVGARQDQASKPMVFALDVTVGLGEGVAVVGRGIDAILIGQLRLESDAGEPIQAYGTLRVKQGTFTAYGRKLAIETGALRFNGAVDNPSLNILAMRRDQEVEAGVAVRGTVLAPRISLVSQPVVPDAEKLSWLVLGRGLDTATGSGDLAALQGAAQALLAEGAASGVQARLATAFGLDELSFGTSSDTLQQNIVTLGKQISSKLYVSIEQGLETATSVLQLRYRISPKLTLEIDTGARTAFTIFYNFAFD